MAEITTELEVAVPVRTAYAQWTQFEDFPLFMTGVREVRQLDDRRLHWIAEIGGRVQEWDAVITDQVPDRRIAWRSVGGAVNAGDVDFEPSDGGTRVRLHLVYGPDGVVEKAGDALGAVRRRVERDLHRFRAFVETRGEATGSWEGRIHAPAPEGARNPER